MSAEPARDVSRPRESNVPHAGSHVARGRALSRRASPAVVLAVAATLGCASCTGTPTAHVEPPDPGALAMRAAVDIRAEGCKAAAFRGAGSVVGDGLIVTAAHVVAGAEQITVRSPAGDVQGRLLALDPVNDLAVVAASLPDRAPLPVAAGSASADEPGVVVVFRDGVPQVQPVTIDAPVIVHILDIFHERKIDRPGYRVDATIEAGDSGAVLVDSLGRATGVFYARSRHTDGRAFATDLSALPTLLAAAAAVDRATGIDTGECV